MNHSALRYRKIRKKQKKKLIIITTSLSCFILLAIVGFSYFVATGNFNGAATIHIPSFAPKTNGSTDMSQTINLAETITNGKNLAPGAIGRFKVDINFTDVETDTYYKVYFDRTNIPNNIHFYVDENLTSELSYIDGVQLKNNSNKLAEHYIYWTWAYNNTPESNANDSLYMDQEIILPFTSYVSQRIEAHTIIVNNQEKPTGRLNLSGRSGSFNMNLDFTNLSVNTNYKIYFNREGIPSNLHLYSDSGYQNEITSITDIYDDATSTEVVKTIYWKTTDSSSVNIDMYYVVYLS